MSKSLVELTVTPPIGFGLRVKIIMRKPATVKGFHRTNPSSLVISWMVSSDRRTCASRLKIDGGPANDDESTAIEVREQREYGSDFWGAGRLGALTKAVEKATLANITSVALLEQQSQTIAQTRTSEAETLRTL
jgi:hypothetical protein